MAVSESSPNWPMDKMLRKQLKVEDSEDVIAAGIYFRKAILCFLLIIVPKGAMDDKVKGDIIKVAGSAGQAFARLIMEMRKKERSG